MAELQRSEGLLRVMYGPQVGATEFATPQALEARSNTDAHAIETAAHAATCRAAARSEAFVVQVGLA